jgi:uncharacterized protein YmfQ (DUF2313 family)
MGIAVARAEQYESAIQKLFPQGEYWDAQFADPASDVSLFVQAKAEELVRFRARMSKLYEESFAAAADELIADWERVLLDAQYPRDTLEVRRERIQSQHIDCLNHPSLQKIAGLYGFHITAVDILRPAFFGVCRFGVDRIAGLKYRDVVFISVDTGGATADAADIAHFESAVRGVMLANQITYFLYSGGNT